MPRTQGRQCQNKDFVQFCIWMVSHFRTISTIISIINLKLVNKYFLLPAFSCLSYSDRSTCQYQTSNIAKIPSPHKKTQTTQASKKYAIASKIDKIVPKQAQTPPSDPGSFSPFKAFASPKFGKYVSLPVCGYIAPAVTYLLTSRLALI